jgi:hypothetical protein
MRKIEYNMESQVVIKIVRTQIKKWVKLKKPFNWVQQQLKAIPSKEELMIKLPRRKKSGRIRLSLQKMQFYWAQIVSRPENVKKYWKTAGGNFPSIIPLVTQDLK